MAASSSLFQILIGMHTHPARINITYTVCTAASLPTLDPLVRLPPPYTTLPYLFSSKRADPSIMNDEQATFFWMVALSLLGVRAAAGMIGLDDD